MSRASVLVGLGLLGLLAAGCLVGDDFAADTVPDNSAGATAGASGASGASAGTAGSSGIAGTTAGGSAGASASGGSGGSSGQSGSAGTSATAGTGGSGGSQAGAAGDAGSAGVSGASGTAGNAGTSGSSGTAGTAGTAGSAGSGTCDPNEDPGDAIFVSKSGNINSAGTKADPVDSIQAGMDLAVFAGKHRVVVDKGLYNESLSITNEHNGLVIEGAWNKGVGETWKRLCTAEADDAVEVHGKENVTVDVQGTTVPVTLRSMQVFTKLLGDKTDGASGESLIGVRVQSSAALTMNRVKVFSFRAADGGAVEPGDPGSGTQCNGLDQCAAKEIGKDGDPGTTGDVGENSTGGSFTSAGFSPGDGGNGDPGGSGGNGGPGGQGDSNNQCINSCSGSGLCITPSLCSFSNTIVSGEQGRCGCGGTGGGAGRGGKGGGASIAVFVAGKLSASHCEFTSGQGGDGALGSDGGTPGTGSPGEMGVAGTCHLQCVLETGMNGNCTCVVGGMAEQVNGGEPGGNGGNGGPGTTGGAGAGGPTIALVRYTDSQVDLTSVTFATGTPGQGAGDAADGLKQDDLQLL